MRLLDDVAVLVAGRRVDLGPARQRCVWAALVVDVNHVVSVERLVERVWGGDAPVRARGTLSSYLSRLRQALAGAGGVELVRRSGGYLLAAEESAVDLCRFRALARRARGAEDAEAVRLLTEALDLWRGEPLSGLTGPWAQAERDRLRQEELAARHELVDARLRAGQGGELLAELSARAARHPLDERVAGQYLLALHRAGRSAQALEHYRLTRQRLVDELGADPGPPLRELHRRILAADPALTAAPGGTARPVVAPRQLPAPPRHFTGRAAELDALDEALDDTGGPVVSVVAGAGGIGKTWLALHWAHRHADRFPDGQLFVDLHGFSPDGDPMDPAAAVRGFLDALGVSPDRLPADPHAQAALYRSLVSDKRVLLVVDNAAHADQVTPLLPGGRTCAVVVTGRTRLPGLVTARGARHLALDVLAEGESRALLTARLGRARAGADHPAVTDLVRLCGGFPLALGVIAARAATEPHLPLADIVAELRDHGLDALDSDDPAASLPAVLSWSLRRLTDRQRTAFALLGITPGPDIDLPAAASLTDLPDRDARATLRALADASLLDHHPGGRYATHDLIRAYATSLAHDLPEPVRSAALERVVDCYLHTAHAAERLLEPHRPPHPLDPPSPGARPEPLPDAATALAWFDTHHPHLLAAQHTAAAHRRHRATWHLAWALTTFHQRRGHRHDDLAAWRAAADAAEHLPDPAALVLAHRFLGNAHAESGQHEQAVEHLHRALAVAEHHHDHAQQAHTHHALAWAWGQRGDDRRALGHDLRALDLWRGLDDPVAEARALSGAGWSAARLGEHDTAREHCRQALVLHRRHDYPYGVAATLDTLGYIDHHTGRHEQAAHHYRQALAVLRDLGDTTHAADTLDHLGHALAALGRRAEARAAWREALELYREQGRDAGADRVLRRLDGSDGSDEATADEPGP
ncbi:AfsR/SARP family transcriptional regulator [Saccharothrix algeriensis]|uniref:DNA-binding SARP family transcriptional activator/Flp pilus assembly protein TadD n=2 Tax=Saccharothrix algeriensis TaxID=173560 RepID=A0ABS2SEQ8_9PSEU|nr:BTAD domain-containing putative transcriptional regulator [Saccharothrix algeriensis]MBM7814752.1 DNA-binding SARP family transcriptional activator/Flp pilus assembly protein TadD [Saccharothrix algeriensis]